MIISDLKANKMHFKTHCFVYKQSKTGLYSYILLHCIFYEVNITIWPLDRPVTAEFTKGFSHEDVTYQHTLFLNSSNNNHYFTN